MRIGVLALQGAFAEHEKKLAQCGAETFEIRQLRDLDRSFDGLVLPGGESTVMGKLLNELNLMKPLKKLITDGMPVMGTCAGLILLAEQVSGGDIHLGTMGITAQRNAYGRQLGSFCANEEFKGIGKIPMTFIRAPYIENASRAEILAYVNGRAVAAIEGNQLALAFHPELEDKPIVHEYFFF